MAPQASITIGTRGSPLALIQAREVRDSLLAAHAALTPGEIEIAVIRTSGDRIQDRALKELGGKGLFTKEIEEALLDRRIDCAVHSMKDMPTALPPGLAIAALLPREDPRDAFLSPRANSLAALPAGAAVGTSSLRRQAQVLARRPDLRVVGFRGNVETRLRKLAEGQADATLLACAGLNRLGMAARMTAPIEPEEMLPAVAQGAIGVEIRDADARLRELLAPLDDADTAVRVAAERACLAALDGSCRTPIAAFAEFETDGRLRLRAEILRPDGREPHRIDERGAACDAEALGRAAGDTLRGRAGPGYFDD